MEALKSQILGYIYTLKQKYSVESVLLARLCFKLRRHVTFVRLAADSLTDSGLLDKFKDDQGKVRYSISDLGLRYIKNNGLITIRDWTTY